MAASIAGNNVYRGYILLGQRPLFVHEETSRGAINHRTASPDVFTRDGGGVGGTHMTYYSNILKPTNLKCMKICQDINMTTNKNKNIR